MNKTIIPFVAMFFASIYAIGQAPTPDGGDGANGADKNFHFGLNFTPGVYFTGTTTPAASNSVGFGFGYGVNLEFYFTQNYAFCTGVEIARMAANWTNTTAWTPKNGQATDSSTAHQYSMQYIEIPLEFKFRTLPIGLIRYFGLVGFNPGIRLSANDNYTVSGQGRNSNSVNYSENNVNLSSNTSIIRLAYVIGGGLEYNLAGTTSLQVSAEYDSGFLNTNTKPSGGFSGNVTTKGITLTIGILF